MNLPNWLTLLRIILIPVFITLLLKFKESGVDSYRWWTTLTFVIAIITDALDGAIARVKNKKTELGTILDPLADKLLLLSGIIILSLDIPGLARLPIWVPISVLSRDFILIIGSVIIYMINNQINVKPNLLGKTTTFFQMATVLWILLGISYPFFVWRIAGSLTILSGLVYIRTGIRQLNSTQKSVPSDKLPHGEISNEDCSNRWKTECW